MQKDIFNPQTVKETSEFTSQVVSVAEGQPEVFTDKQLYCIMGIQSDIKTDF